MLVYNYTNIKYAGWWWGDILVESHLQSQAEEKGRSHYQGERSSVENIATERGHTEKNELQTVIIVRSQCIHDQNIQIIIIMIITNNYYYFIEFKFSIFLCNKFLM